MGNLVEVHVPDIGDFKEVEVIELLVKPGDKVAPEQSLITVESDKASMEIPSMATGTVKEMKVQLGAKVSEGSLILLLEPEGAGRAGAAASSGPPAPSAPPPAARKASEGSTVPLAPVAPQARPAQGVGTVEVRVPDIGDFKEVEVIELLVKPGDTVAPEQSLISVESDKASMEIPSPAAGVVRQMKVALGDKVSEGSLVLLLDVPPSLSAAPAAAPTASEDAAAPAAASSPSSTAFAVEMGARPSADEAAAMAAGRSHASPSVRRTAREFGVDLGLVRGSGPKGRITQEDVRAFVKSALQGQGAARAAGAAAGPAGGTGLNVLPWPQIDFSRFGPVERVEMSRIRKLSGPNLHRNWVTIPHVTNHDDADITDLEAFRVQINKENEKSGTKVTMLAFLIKACVAALQRFPDFNSSIDAASGDAIIRKKYYHIGFAADTPNGLVVPVVRDADRKGVLELARDTAALAAKARDGKLAPGDMQGGTFSISSLGGIGGTYFTPIINAPEVAILGVCRAAMRPTWDGQQFVPRLILPLSLSWDHRVVDGAGAARFNALVAQLLADFRRVLV
jgi:pyruvate dehydrogenase E2 component (dihydrolipoamide acetyltransferase)